MIRFYKFSKRIVDVLDKKYAIMFHDKREFIEFYYCLKKLEIDWCEKLFELKFVPFYCLSVDGEFDYSNKRISRKIGYKIIDWSKFDEYGSFRFNNLRFIKDDLKNGDLCVFENGQVYIAIPSINALVSKYDTVSMRFLNDILVLNFIEKLRIVKIYRPQYPSQCNLINEPNCNLVYSIIGESNHD